MASNEPMEKTQTTLPPVKSVGDIQMLTELEYLLTLQRNRLIMIARASGNWFPKVGKMFMTSKILFIN
jgi:hypothetical protein